MVQEIFFFNQKKDHYKPAKIANAFRRNYIKYKSNGHKGQILSFKDYLNMIKSNLSHMKMELTMAIKSLFF